MPEPDVSQIIAGPALLYVAALGTTLPTLTLPLVWPAGWRQVGYTDAGVDAIYTPTIKEIYVDEETAPVDDILEKEKFVISAHLAELGLKNLNTAIAASAYVPTGNPTLSAGSLALNYIMVGVVGPAPDTFTSRVILLQKALSTAAVNLKMTRKDKQIIPVSFDARKIQGQNLFTIQDLGTGYEGS